MEKPKAGQVEKPLAIKPAVSPIGIFNTSQQLSLGSFR